MRRRGGMQELTRDVGENGSPARGDAALGHENEKAREEFARVYGREGFREFGEELRGEVGGVARERSKWKTGSDLAIIVPEAKAGPGEQAWESAASAVRIAEVTTGRVVERPSQAARPADATKGWAGIDCDLSGGGC